LTVPNFGTRRYYVYTTYLTSAGFSIFAILFAAWLVGIFSIWKTMPNLLSVTIFTYKCLGHWALVSFFIILFYMSQYLPSTITSYLSAGFLPPVVLLLFTADVMRTQRAKMWEALNAEANKPATTATAPSVPLNP
jgi:hypothetical protein